MNHRFQKLLMGSLLAGALSLGGSVFAQAPAAAPAAPAATKPAKAAKAAAAAPSAQDVADAKAKGLVWVNTSTKAYHKADDKYYGTTKRGKFMSEEDAQKAGYHLAGAKKPSAAKK